MTLEERWRAADKEYRDLIKEEWAQIEKVTAQLKQAGKYKPGLDTNRQAYAPIHEEFRKRKLALYDKYDLPKELPAP